MRLLRTTRSALRYAIRQFLFITDIVTGTILAKVLVTSAIEFDTSRYTNTR